MDLRSFFNQKKILLFLLIFLISLFAFGVGYIFGASIFEECKIIIEKR